MSKESNPADFDPSKQLTPIRTRHDPPCPARPGGPRPADVPPLGRPASPVGRCGESAAGKTREWVRITGLMALLFFLAGCQSAYYATMEKFGVHKREILKERVEKARDAEEEAKEQFASALERFRSVVRFEGGTLEEKYEELNRELEVSEEQAALVRNRIDSVEDVAGALFDEWEDELDQYTNASLRKASKRTLETTRIHYARLMAAMKRAEAKIEPVLRPLRDQVLFLKHNLNARAIAALETELTSVETEVASLIREMEAAIVEADSFIRTLERDGG